jgi:phosphoglycerol transferase MdoB-like AlkP superfamily enzyme
MDRFIEPLPADFPIFGGHPVWIFFIVVLAAIAAGAIVNNLFFSWLRRYAPWFFRPRTLLAIIALGIATIVFGMLLNPPSEIRKAFQRQNPNWPSPSPATISK